MRELYGFPIEVSPGQGEPSQGENEDVVVDNDTFHLAYYSNLGPITTDQGQEEPIVVNKNVEIAVIVIHGSRRDADDYFCTGLSLIEKEQNQSKVLILAPWFATDDDIDAKRGSTTPDGFHIARNDKKRFLVWDYGTTAYDSLIEHIWRYGADAANAPISSFTALDHLVEHLVTDTNKFPNLQRITVVGHSGTCGN
jgi:hypothetical protein